MDMYDPIFEGRSGGRENLLSGEEDHTAFTNRVRHSQRRPGALDPRNLKSMAEEGAAGCDDKDRSACTWEAALM